MADFRSLRFIGFAYGALTAAVGLIAIVVVSGHVFGTMTLDDGNAVAKPAAKLAAKSVAMNATQR